ncbi:MAG: N-acetylmuramoyl-L-alanine amidase, partial [candidate division Zixibacteria bacterium]|nr:N-acetylmuramoyl-L-alanine amidase [candidate division Zixibacteria bacterium]
SFPVHPDGGYIGFVALKSGDFTFDITAHLKPAPNVKKHSSVLAKGSVKVIVPSAPRTPSRDTLRITGAYHPPKGDLALRSNDLLEVAFQGTPGAVAWFAVPGLVDSVPMTEIPPRTQSFWGDAVFGESKLRDSVLPGGVYTGYYSIPLSARIDTARLRYYLASSKTKAVDPAQDMPKRPGVVSDSSLYRLTCNSPEFPFTVRVKDSIIVIRHGVMAGYLATYQPRGVDLLVVGTEADWYKVKLSENQYGWVNSAQVERLPKGVMPPRSEIRSVRHFSYPDSVVFQFPVIGMHPFRCFEDDRRKLRLQLFGVLSNTDWIRYDMRDSLIDYGSWEQPERDLYEFTLNLRQDIWGYDCYYNKGNFCLKIIRAPKDLSTLKGKRIVVDPGHSNDPGSIGPSGYTEAEANLAIALEVRDALVAHGATVIMTRPDMRHVALADRPVIARASDCDIFVSIHNNALPDGVNPFGEFGTASFYYHPHSIDLAKAIHTEMLKETGLPDYGVYHGNLAVIRPTSYPSVLVECAFMMLPEQEALIKTVKFRKQVAKAVTAGLERFCKEFGHGR